MEAKQIKKKIQQDLDQIIDTEKLEALSIFIDSQILNSDLELNDEQKKRLNISRREITENKLISNDEVDKEIEDWLEK